MAVVLLRSKQQDILLPKVRGWSSIGQAVVGVFESGGVFLGRE